MTKDIGAPAAAELHVHRTTLTLWLAQPAEQLGGLHLSDATTRAELHLALEATAPDGGDDPARLPRRGGRTYRQPYPPGPDRTGLCGDQLAVAQPQAGSIHENGFWLRFCGPATLSIDKGRGEGLSGSPWPIGHRFAGRVRARHAAVHALLAAGHSHRSIQRPLGMTWRTVIGHAGFQILRKRVLLA
ncbi:hypothetical protein ACFVG1_24800 [Streptomyces bacillaris]|uniref:hypothetical protein n=1 Tax=Streptomyces TaxID=1883 RepID=UPI0035D8D3CF